MNDDRMRHYPDDDEKRIAFWSNQMKASEDQMRPYVKAGVRLTRLYNSIGSTTREESLDSYDNENINRVKGSAVFAWVDQSLANMYDDDIKFALTPTTAASKDGKMVVEAAINRHYLDSEQAQEDYRMCLQAHLMPFAVKKVGWSSLVEEREEHFLGDLSNIVIDDPEKENEALLENHVTKVMINQDHDIHIEEHVLALQTPGISAEQITLLEDHIAFHEELDEMRNSPESDARVAWEAPFGTNWDIDDYRQDTAATKGNKDARWIAFRTRQPLHWWKAKFPTKTEELKPNSSASLNRDDRNDRESGFDDFGMVEGWEVWAKDFPVRNGETANVFMVFVEGHNEVLLHEEEWPHENIDQYPAIILQFQENLKTWINKPTLSLGGADNIQQLMNEFFDSMLYTIRKQKNLWLYDKDLFKADEVNEILSAPDNTAYGISGLSEHRGGAFVPIPFNQVSGDQNAFIQQIQAYFDRSVGTPQPIKTPGEKTATEIGSTDRRNTAREDQRRRRYNRMQIETARFFWKLHQEYRPETQFLVDPRLDDFATVTSAIAKGEYRFDVRVMNRLESQALQRKNLMDLFNLSVGTIPAFMQLKLDPPNIVALFERLLREGFNIQDVHDILPQVPSEFEKQIAAIKDDPEQMINTLNAFSQMSGGTPFGPTGNGAGSPAVPSQAGGPPPSEGGIAQQAPSVGAGNPNAPPAGTGQGR
jgi:hypothetical protein